MGERRFLDLHTHSSASDGSLAPAELVALADAEKLVAMALTDHDTTAGLAEARRAAEALPELHFIAGVEVSAEFAPGVLHILGLGVNEDSAALARLAGELRDAREQRNPKIIAKLQALGMAIDMDDVAAQAGAWHGRPARVPPGPPDGPIHDAPPILGRGHIAMAMVAKGQARSTDEAFDRYIGKGGPAYVEKDKLPPRAVIEAIHAAGALAALAHPPQLLCRDAAELTAVVRRLIDAGLDAVEVYHSDHAAEQTRQYLDLARRLGLGVAGGSDFHGALKPAVRLGRPRVTRAMIAGIVADRLLAPSR